MGPRNEQYRWWLLDGELDIVSDGTIGGASLLAALAALNRKLGRRTERLDDRPNHPWRPAYSLIVYKGDAVVAVRPATLGIC